MDNFLHIEQSVGFMFMFIGIFYLFDFATGMYRAIKNKEVESRKMKKGLLNFCGIILVMITAEIAGMFIDLFGIFPHPQLWICGAVTFYFIIMEAVSILENLHDAGFKRLPNRLVQYLKTKDDGQIGDDVIDVLIKTGNSKEN